MAPRVSLFVTCIVDQLFPKVGMAMADVLEHAGCESIFEKPKPAAVNPRSTAALA